MRWWLLPKCHVERRGGDQAAAICAVAICAHPDAAPSGGGLDLAVLPACGMRVRKQPHIQTSCWAGSAHHNKVQSAIVCDG